MLIIPVQAVKNQNVGVSLSQQPVKLDIYQKSTGLFVDILLNDAGVLYGVLALSGVRMVRDAYLGFPGDLVFIDTQPPPTGAQDPDYTSLGTRWVLFYLEPADITGDV